jgi:ABC-type uncharacterized transport system auxiliary subunit
MSRPSWLLAWLMVLGGCLFRTTDSPRFFRPVSATLDATVEDDAASPAAGGIAIRLREVRSEPFLRERIVWRVSEVEYGFYEQRRWIDLPAHYVERALRTRLSATPGLRLTDDPRAAALQVEVLAFDDVLAPTHVANVALVVALQDPVRGRLFARTLDARVGIENGDPASTAKAMGRALDDAVAQVADAVRLSLQAHRATSPSGDPQGGPAAFQGRPDPREVDERSIPTVTRPGGVRAEDERRSALSRRPRHPGLIARIRSGGEP